MKKIKVLALILAAVMLVGMFAACNGGRNRKIVGTWVEIDEDGDGDTYTFARNGKGSVKSSDGMSGDMTWSTEGDVLSMSLTICGMSETQEVRFKISGKTMTWYDIDDGSEIGKLKKK